MPLVKTLGDRVQKFTKKTAPDRVGARYGAVKDIAVIRYVDAVSDFDAVRERTRNILESEGVPPAQHGVYYAFAQKAAAAAQSHSGESLAKFVEGLKLRFVGLGADPTILDKIARLIIG